MNKLYQYIHQPHKQLVKPQVWNKSILHCKYFIWKASDFLVCAASAHHIQHKVLGKTKYLSKLSQKWTVYIYNLLNFNYYISLTTFRFTSQLFLHSET